MAKGAVLTQVKENIIPFMYSGYFPTRLSSFYKLLQVESFGEVLLYMKCVSFTNLPVQDRRSLTADMK